MMIDERLFDGCPYTGKTCFNAWDCANCANCEVEAEERRWMEEMDEEDDGTEPVTVEEFNKMKEEENERVFINLPPLPWTEG